MNTEYSIGRLRIRFESRARRRWFVAFFYAVLALSVLAGFSVSAKNTTGQSGVSGGLFLFVVLWIVFTWVAGDMRARGDERETHRRDHAHFRAYQFFSFVLMGMLLVRSFSVPNPVAPPLPLALRGILAQPNVLAVSAFLLYITLPQAILLWTEPDMDRD
ncbi:MAG: hypothetical protein WAN28_13255, partial [Terracidiphilus sp.]